MHTKARRATWNPGGTPVEPALYSLPGLRMGGWEERTAIMLATLGSTLLHDGGHTCQRLEQQISLIFSFI